MDKSAYLLLSLTLLLILLIILHFRKDLETKILISGLMGGIAGFIAEFWYHKDYWHPPTVLGQTTISIEDFLFGLSITGISVSIYDLIFNKTIKKTHKHELFTFILLFILGVLWMLIFTNYLGINSIFTTSIYSILVSFVVYFKRKDLFFPSVSSAVFLVLIIVPIYIFIFGYAYPDYWNEYWLLSNSGFDYRVFGIPLTEIFWYFSWGLLGSVGYDFVFGNKKVKLN